MRDTLTQLGKDANIAKDTARVKRASYPGMNDQEFAKTMAYLSGLRDATHALLTALNLDAPPSEHLLCNEYLINDELAKIAFGRTINI